MKKTLNDMTKEELIGEVVDLAGALVTSRTVNDKTKAEGIEEAIDACLVGDGYTIRTSELRDYAYNLRAKANLPIEPPVIKVANIVVGGGTGYVLFSDKEKSEDLGKISNRSILSQRYILEKEGYFTKVTDTDANIVHKVMYDSFVGTSE